MKYFIKLTLKKIIELIFRTKLSNFIQIQLQQRWLENKTNVVHNDCSIIFITPNPLTKLRAKTFSSKEPETLAWIDKMERNKYFWDVGANVGTYSIYAAKKRFLNVVCFEPSIFNIELLGRNVSINNVSNKITIISSPLTSVNGISSMKHSQVMWGGAHNSFGADFDSDGKSYNTLIEYALLGFTADELVKANYLNQPDYIKIDVDGIEHLILRGAINTLQKVKSVLVEVNENFVEHALEVKKILENNNFTMVQKGKSPLEKNSPEMNTFNQIWKNKALM